MLPALKNNAAAGYQGPVKIELLRVEVYGVSKEIESLMSDYEVSDKDRN